MMGWIIIFLIGIIGIDILVDQLKPLEKIGLAFPIGIGCICVILILLDLVNIPFHNIYLILCLLLGTVVLAKLFLVKKNKSSFLFPDLKSLKNQLRNELSIAWLIFFSVIIYIVFAVVTKSLYWPVFIYDSVNGYEFLAKAIIHEGSFNNSLFNPDYPLTSVRSYYPPLIPYSFSLAHLLETENSKIIVVLYYVSIILVFYSFLRKVASPLLAILLTMLLVITPEYASFNALSSPNPPCTFYTSLGILSLFIAYKSDKRDYLLLGMTLIFFALLTRSESIVFFVSGAILVSLYSNKKKKWISLISYLSIGSFIFLAWQWYINYGLAAPISSPVNYGINLDFEKLKVLITRVGEITLSTKYYGIIIYLFLIMLVLNAPKLAKSKIDALLPMVILISWIMFVFIFYQLNVDFTKDTQGGWIGSGYKRGLFYFLPLMLYYCADNPIQRKLVKSFGRFSKFGLQKS